MWVFLIDFCLIQIIEELLMQSWGYFTELPVPLCHLWKGFADTYQSLRLQFSICFRRSSFRRLLICSLNMWKSIILILLWGIFLPEKKKTCRFQIFIQTCLNMLIIWNLHSWMESKTKVMLRLINSGLQNVKTIPHTLSHKFFLLVKLLHFFRKSHMSQKSSPL